MGNGNENKKKIKVITFDNLSDFTKKFKKWTQNKLDKLSSNDDELSNKIKDLEKADEDILKEIKSLGKGNSNTHKKLSELENDCNFITKNDLPTKISAFENDKGYITKDEIQTQNNSPIGTIILLPSCVERPDDYLPCNQDQCLNPEILWNIMYDDISTEFINLSRKMAGDNFPMRGEIYLPNYSSPKGTIYYIKYK